MAEDKEKSVKHLAAVTAKRPKAGSYHTFTISQRGESRQTFQKIRYESKENRGGRVLVDDKVGVTICRGVEFDVWRECLGSKDGKVLPNKTFHDLVTKGYKLNGDTKYLDPADLQEFLEEKLTSDANRIILWKDRPRPENEKALEKALETSSKRISDMEAREDVLRKLAAGRGIKNEDIEAALAKVG